jgi:hypothetical protein
MPDLITHLTVSHLMRRPFDFRQIGKSSWAFRTIFYLGAVLPDIFTRPMYILLPVTQDWIFFIHTPFGALVLCGLITFLFEASLRKRIFLNLISGSAIHFLLDASQIQLYGSYYWFFPFSWKTIQTGFTDADNIIPWIPVWILLVIITEILISLLRRSKKKGKP